MAQAAAAAQRAARSDANQPGDPQEGGLQAASKGGAQMQNGNGPHGALAEAKNKAGDWGKLPKQMAEQLTQGQREGIAGRVSQPGRDVLSRDRREIEEAVRVFWNHQRGLRWRAVAQKTVIMLSAALTLALPVTALQAEDKVDEAMAKATQYLMSTQDPVTGGIHNKMRHETAMTSLAILAMAACGNQPSDPTPEGESMRKALAFVLRPDAQEKDGYFGQTDGSRMYGARHHHADAFGDARHGWGRGAG